MELCFAPSQVQWFHILERYGGSVRDDFAAKTKRTLEARVGHLCSNPGCQRPTAGPGLPPGGTVNIGVAAHITAASPGTAENPGPRYDKSLTPRQRRDVSNGIWLCQTCAKLIDSDVPRFTADLLRKWKQDAENRALLAIATSSKHVNVSFGDLDDSDRSFLRDLALPEQQGLEFITAGLKQAARDDLAAFRSTRDWPTHAIELELSLKENGRQNAVTLTGLATAVGVVETLSIISPPGTGKTTTVIQLADKIIDGGEAVPLLVPLAEWSGNREDFFELITRRNAFRKFRPQHLQLLAFYGRIVLLVDGWNEADAPSRIHATKQIEALSRDFPLLSTVIATRQQAVPRRGPIIEIAGLSAEQQIEIAQRFPGGSKEAVVDRAWRIPGLRELIATPLYLKALLACTEGASFPQTREELLGKFVAEHERAPDKAETLRTELFGCHRQMLAGLAVEANRLGTTTITDENARQIVTQIGAQLVVLGQLSHCPQPSTVLDALVNLHALVRAANGSLSFQHQQFQEWYASFEVEQLILKAARNDAAARATLRTDVLNWLPWEESILFACERLSRGGEIGAKAAGVTITETLGIDPMLAAEMIFRSGETAWHWIKDEVIHFVGGWHKPGQVDRAVRFMITTGRSEFAPQVWPLVSDPDSQVHLTALRKADRFRPAVLGPDAIKRLSELPVHIRGSVFRSIAHESGFDGLELATRAAKEDPDPDVVVEIIHALAFRRADRHVTEILAAASDAVWSRLANGYGVDLVEPAQRARLAALMKGPETGETDPVQVVVRLAGSLPSEQAVGERIANIIEQPFFPGNTEQGAFAIKRAFGSYPVQTRRALFNRLQAGLPLPRGIEDFINDSPPVDEGPVAAAVLDPAAPEPLARLAPRFIGPETIGKVLEQLFVLDAKGRSTDWREEPTRKEYWRLKDVLGVTRLMPFVAALLKRAESDDPHRIQLMSDLFARHGRHGGDGQMLALSSEMSNALTIAIEHWISLLLPSLESNRHQLADLARAVECMPKPQFASVLAKMLERDLADWTRAREALRKSPRGGPIGPDASMSYTLQYQRAFIAIGSADVVDLMKRYLPDKRFGVDAALVLSAIWAKGNGPILDPRFGAWDNSTNVKVNRQLRQDERNPLPTSEFAEAIFNVVRELGTARTDIATQQHAIQLATVALRLPHGSKLAEIDALMKLPLPFAAKRGLLTAAAEAGEILKAQDLIEGVKELLELAKRETWRLDKNSGELLPWLSLFPFSDRPIAVMEFLATIPRHHCEPWDLDRLLIALSNSPHEETLEVFKALVEWDQRILNNHYWLHSLLRIGTEAAASLVVDLICDGKLPAGSGFPERQFAELARRRPSIRTLLLQRYATMGPGRPQATLEAILLEMADPEIVLTLVKTYARNKYPFNGNLAHAIHETAVGRRPAPDFPNSYYRFSVPLTDLRKELFDMVLTNGPESGLASACLTEIEELRDEHGRLNEEPRHPNIESGRPLPFDPATPPAEEPGLASRKVIRFQL